MPARPRISLIIVVSNKQSVIKRRCLASLAPLLQQTTAAELSEEGQAEVAVVQSVHCRVDGRVGVTDPEESRDKNRGRDARVTQGNSGVPKKEGQPAAQETAHNYA